CWLTVGDSEDDYGHYYTGLRTLDVW
nr:immunoglobulin heavy chain junction region [Macaca mulatta]MOV87460.1 immunoglobulin heavy chain junction region [Macaca mulatta]MOV88069.1 immunoglobulin heavy chain junction region [Macaca mulatta]MOV88227.1 immunoglobulin heavy chain junction region [Macaca mulatta]MOV88942.1 immunoglobulin heavy chain junction region [Macaca mulatta]